MVGLMNNELEVMKGSDHGIIEVLNWELPLWIKETPPQKRNS
jgi:hypothetical protein